MRHTVNIGLINIMPNVSQYESLIRNALNGLEDAITLHPIKLEEHQYKSSSMPSNYRTFEETVAATQLDLLIVTGAPVEHLPFEEITYWDELCEIFRYAQKNLASVLGICFGGLAVARFLGIKKYTLNDKAYGVHSLLLNDESHRYFPAHQRTYDMPMSTWAALDACQVRQALGRSVRGIAYHMELGYTVLESVDHKFLMVLGHPEYTVQTLRDEWQRDLARGVAYAQQLAPEAFAEMESKLDGDSNKLIDRWVRSHMAESLAETKY
ncbi:homoserine O-succinyltransferase [Massilia sp. BJB1822]|uniref:homoserine O-acetyltransferase/O-succinyltransferase family protein n=1 Tax=Massilia sp. BJB1822 TaxID=2744470 RepID=UPI001594D211|nr:homoserine O-succinyltransferase [Massilia sp. BJB1822]NVE00638.1 homoserine O-succinyltransferase [Massilia sp. BJB1822]